MVAVVLCYIVLGRHLMNRRHGEIEELTASQEEVGAVSETVSWGRVDDGGGWREKECAGEVESKQIRAKMKN